MEDIRGALQGVQRLSKDKNITDLVTQVEATRWQHVRQTYQDRGSSKLKRVHGVQEDLRLAKAGLYKDTPAPFVRNAAKQAIEHHLDHVGQQKMCGRSELMRKAQLPDVSASAIHLSDDLT